jgi:tetratricopeptide (TPR) repeat protein
MIRKLRLVVVALLLAIFCPLISPQAQTVKPVSLQAASVAARKRFAVYLASFHDHPEDAELRDKIVELAKTLKPAPVVPQAVRADFAKATVQFHSAATTSDFQAAAKLFEQVALQAPWYADAYYNAASAYAKAGDYENAQRNLALCMAAARPDTDTHDAENLQHDLERQQSQQRFQQALQQFRRNPDDTAREQIIKLALTMDDPTLSLSDEVHVAAGSATYASKSATSERELVAAAQAWAQVSLLAPWVAEYYFNQGVAYQRAKHFDKAIAAFNWYLIAAPNAKDAGEVRESIGGLKYAKEKAAQEQQEAAERAEHDRQRCSEFEQEVNLGNTFVQSSPAVAIEHYQKGLALCPEHSEAFRVYCNWAVAADNKSGDWADALPYVQKGLALRPDDATCNAIMGSTLWFGLHDRSGACRYWRKACQMGAPEPACKNSSSNICQ